MKAGCDLSEDRLSQRHRPAAWRQLVASPCETSDSTCDTDAPAPLRFERREHDRWLASGVARAARVAGERFGEMYTLKMLDYSPLGLGAACAQPIEPGTIVTIGFQEPGCTAQRGVVVRCLPCGDGYRLAIRFDASLAA